MGLEKQCQVANWGQINGNLVLSVVVIHVLVDSTLFGNELIKMTQPLRPLRIRQVMPFFELT